MPEIKTFKELQAVPEAQTSCSLFLAWAKKYGVQDEWILDAAVQTALADETQWQYRAPDLPLPEFTPRFGFWVPEPNSPWTQFAKDAARDFSRQLAEYRAKVEITWGTRNAVRMRSLNHLGAVWMQNIRRVNSARNDLSTLGDHPNPANSDHLKTGQRK